MVELPFFESWKALKAVDEKLYQIINNSLKSKCCRCLLSSLRDYKESVTYVYVVVTVPLGCRMRTWFMVLLHANMAHTLEFPSFASFHFFYFFYLIWLAAICLPWPYTIFVNLVRKVNFSFLKSAMKFTFNWFSDNFHFLF